MPKAENPNDATHNAVAESIESAVEAVFSVLWKMGYRNASREGVLKALHNEDIYSPAFGCYTRKWAVKSGDFLIEQGEDTEFDKGSIAEQVADLENKELGEAFWTKMLQDLEEWEVAQLDDLHNPPDFD